MDIDNIQAVIDAAREGVAATKVAEANGVRILWSAKRGLETVEIEQHEDKPRRKRGTTTVFDAESLNHLLLAHAVPDQTVIYVNPDMDRPAIVAVFNGNGAASPGHGDFRAQIGFRPSPQWVKWKGIDGKLLPQSEFAEFVEENLADIVNPDGATMMEIVTYLQATRTVDFKSGIKLSSGQVQLTNVENIEAQVGAGNIAVPDSFEIALSPFFGVKPFRVPARFRYRIEGGKLKLGFKLLRLEDVMQQVIAGIEGDIVLPSGVGKVYGVAP